MVDVVAGPTDGEPSIEAPGQDQGQIAGSAGLLARRDNKSKACEHQGRSKKTLSKTAFLKE